MKTDEILKCLIAFVLGYLVSCMMRGNGFSIGGLNLEKCPSGKDGYIDSCGYIGTGEDEDGSAESECNSHYSLGPFDHYSSSTDDIKYYRCQYHKGKGCITDLSDTDGLCELDFPCRKDGSITQKYDGNGIYTPTSPGEICCPGLFKKDPMSYPNDQMEYTCSKRPF